MSDPYFYYFRILFGTAETVPAVNRLIAARLKGDFSLLAAASAGDRIHLAWASITRAAIISITLSSSGRTTRRTALGLIGKAFSGKEFLLFSRKGERFSAIGTCKGFFSVSH
jgi:hypothetical protein